jgi:hypothetical protein
MSEVQIFNGSVVRKFIVSTGSLMPQSFITIPVEEANKLVAKYPELSLAGTLGLDSVTNVNEVEALKTEVAELKSKVKALTLENGRLKKKNTNEDIKEPEVDSVVENSVPTL